MVSRFQSAGVVEVEVLQALAGGEPGGADATLTAVGFAGGDLTLQAGGEELFMGPGLIAGTLGQPRDGFAQRGRLQRAGEELQLTGDVAAGARLGRHQPAPASTPSAVS